MTIRVFLSGQSNAQGATVGGPDWAGISSDVRVWNSVNPLGDTGNAFVSAVDARSGGAFGPATNRNNFGVWFCDKLARTEFDSVDLTVSVRSASPIALWAPDEATYPMLASCVDTWAATGQAPANVFLWHQGEGDVVAADFEGYIAAFYTLLDNLETGGVIDASTMVLIGGLTEATAAKMQFDVHALFGAAGRRNITFVPSYGLESDATHFSGAALTLLGAHRYFSAYRFAQKAALAGAFDAAFAPRRTQPIVSLTQPAYDALSPPDAGTLYVIVAGPAGGAGAEWLEVTQAQYDALSPPDAGTLYVVID